jgi:alpha-tubulin suppressor-like RCC1 family protein
MRGRVLIGVACSCMPLLAVLAVPVSAWSASAGASAAVSGSVRVSIVGLPPGQAVHGVLRGPDGLERSVSAAGLTISKARAGRYWLTLRPVTISRSRGPIEKGAVGRPVQRITSVRVRAEHRSSLVGIYGSIINPGIKTLSGGVVSVTGSPEDPTAVALSGHQTFGPRAIISMTPSVQLPRGLLSHVVAVSYRADNTVLSLRAASIYEVAPNFQFNVPLEVSQATAAAFSAGCGLPSGLSPYRRIKSVSFSGGWSTAGVFGVHVTDGIRTDVHFTVEAGIEVTAGAGLSCSLSLAFYADGLAGPIPVTAGIEGDLTGSAAVGGVLDSGGSVEVEAGGHTVGFPPVLLLIPDVSFASPHFTLTAKQFAQATAGIGLTVKAGVGVGGAASLTLNVGTSLNFNAHPASCLWDAKFGQFSAEGELLDWHLSTPQTPALFTQQLGGNLCATSGSGGGGAGSGGSGSGSTPPGGGGSAPPGGGSSPPGGGGPGGGSIHVTAVTAGFNTCALLSGGSVECWGDNEFGELGNGTNPQACNEGGSPCSARPVAVSEITGATQLSAGPTGTVCALLFGGRVDCWGRASEGELGDGTNTGPEGCAGGEACSTTPVAVRGITDATYVSAGSQHTCALLSGGEVACWGLSEWLGDGDVGSESCPTLDSEECSTIPKPVSGIIDATQISTAGDQTCALLSNGHVDCWGYNMDGELGDGTTLNAEVPVAVSGITDATQITAGGFQTCALLSGGGVDCWGDNAYGELGIGTTIGPETCENEVEPCSKTPVPVSGVTHATQISSGGEHTCALLSGGSIDCWGQNEYGELGNATNTGPESCYTLFCSTAPVAVSGITAARQITAGEDQTCALLSEGGVDCWGYNGDGELGDGTTTDSDVPVSVSGFE